MSSLLANQAKLKERKMQRSSSTPDMRVIETPVITQMTQDAKSGVLPTSRHSGVIVPAKKPKEDAKQTITYKFFKIGQKEAYDHPRRQLSTARKKLQYRLDAKGTDANLKHLMKQLTVSNSDERLPQRSKSFDSHVPAPRFSLSDWEDAVEDDESLGSPVVLVPPGSTSDYNVGATVFNPIKLPGIRGRRGEVPSLEGIPVAGHHIHLTHPPSRNTVPLDPLDTCDTCADEGIDFGDDLTMFQPVAPSPSASPDLPLHIDTNIVSPPLTPLPRTLSPRLSPSLSPSLSPQMSPRQLADAPMVPYIAPGQGILPRRISVGRMSDTAVPSGMVPMPIQLGDPHRLDHYAHLPSRVDDITEDILSGDEERERRPSRSKSPHSPLTFDFIQRSPTPRRHSASRSPRLSPSPSPVTDDESADEVPKGDRVSALIDETVKLQRDRSLRSKMLKSKTGTFLLFCRLTL